MNHLSLCSGIGGIDLAAEACGFRTVAFVEKEPFCQQVLKIHWPETPVFDDVKEFTAHEYRGKLELVSCGFPCQDVSIAGQAKGFGDEETPTRSGLWYSCFRIIRESEPRFVLAENVIGLYHRGLDRVCADLERAGYNVACIRLGSCDVGAPHQRHRVFIVGELIPDADGMRESQPQRGQPNERERPFDGSERAMEYAPVVKADGGIGGGIIGETPGRQADIDTTGTAGKAAAGAAQRNPGGCGLERNLGGFAGTQPANGHAGRKAASVDRGVGQSDASIDRCQEQRERRASPAEYSAVEFGDRGRSESGLGGMPHGVSDWLDCGTLWPAGKGEDQYPWEPPRLIEGRHKFRAARLKALGNAVNPWQVYPILKAIAERAREGA